MGQATLRPAQERERFKTQARPLLVRIPSELPADWVVEGRFRPL